MAAEDWLERLPDPVVVLILGKVGDATSLGRCAAVCRRLRCLSRQTDAVVLRLDGGGDRIPSRRRRVLTALLRFVPRPLQAVTARLFSSAAVARAEPAAVLRQFGSVRRIRVEAAAGEIRVGPGELVTWRAEFGGGFERCAVLGAAAAVTAAPPAEKEGGAAGLRREERIPGSFFSDGRLKRGVTWTISSLVAASTRHHSLRPIAAGHVALERLEFADGDSQGLLVMGRRHLAALRAQPAAAAAEERTAVPAVKMTMWFAPRVELGAGTVLEGATLVAARPSQGSGGDELEWLEGAFEEPYAAAVKQLVRREMYSLEMNAF